MDSVCPNRRLPSHVMGVVTAARALGRLHYRLARIPHRPVRRHRDVGALRQRSPGPADVRVLIGCGNAAAVLLDNAAAAAHAQLSRQQYRRGTPSPVGNGRALRPTPPLSSGTALCSARGTGSTPAPPTSDLSRSRHRAPRPRCRGVPRCRRAKRFGPPASGGTTGDLRSRSATHRVRVVVIPVVTCPLSQGPLESVTFVSSTGYPADRSPTPGCGGLPLHGSDFCGHYCAGGAGAVCIITAATARARS
jgi:hypothetical protein